MSDGMRFGLFLPQGWRLDLAGIKPADQLRWSTTWRDDVTIVSLDPASSSEASVSSKRHFTAWEARGDAASSEVGT
jgi:hypothetical protein